MISEKNENGARFPVEKLITDGGKGGGVGRNGTHHSKTNTFPRLRSESKTNNITVIVYNIWQ